MLISRLKNLVSDHRFVEHCSLRLNILFLGYEVDEELSCDSTSSRTCQLFLAAVLEQLFDHFVARWAGQGPYPSRSLVLRQSEGLSGKLMREAARRRACARLSRG
jgi:hypothetical protein